MENCEQDPGWCFQSAIGNLLPSDIHGHGHGHESTNQKDDFVVSTDNTLNCSSVEETTWPNLHWGELPVIRKRTLTSLRAYPKGSLRLVIGERREEKGMDCNGYHDGKLTAQLFASHNTSRLGFIDQYIADSFANLGTHEDYIWSKDEYSRGFWRGLNAGEALL